VLDDQQSTTYFLKMMLVDPLKRTNQAAFFFPLGSGATLAFRFDLGAFNAAHRLICACRMRPRPSALILRRILAF
jgi:hypothetical protein